MNIVTLDIYYADGLTYSEHVVCTVRTAYYIAMNRIRYERRAGHEFPYMKCSNPRLNFWLTCCRMSVNYGFDI